MLMLEVAFFHTRFLFPVARHQAQVLLLLLVPCPQSLHLSFRVALVLPMIPLLPCYSFPEIFVCAGVVDNDLSSRLCLPMTSAYVIKSGRSSLQSVGLVLSIAMVMYTTIATYRAYLHDVPTSLLVILKFRCPYSLNFFLPTLLLYRSICLGAFNFAGSFTVSLVLLLTS